MRRNGSILAHSKAKHPTAKESAPRLEEVIQDASGENWDEAALRAIESLTHPVKEDVKPNTKAPTDEEEFPRPNLTRADLHGADLRTADLRGTILTKANLSEARLDKAKLNRADLRGADLRSCNLSEASLTGANLYGAFFNQKTRLPFDKAEAIRRGMIFFDVDPD